MTDRAAEGPRQERDGPDRGRLGDLAGGDRAVVLLQIRFTAAANTPRIISGSEGRGRERTDRPEEAAESGPDGTRRS